VRTKYLYKYHFPYRPYFYLNFYLILLMCTVNQPLVSFFLLCFFQKNKHKNSKTNRQYLIKKSRIMWFNITFGVRTVPYYKPLLPCITTKSALYLWYDLKPGLLATRHTSRPKASCAKSIKLERIKPAKPKWVRTAEPRPFHE